MDHMSNAFPPGNQDWYGSFTGPPRICRSHKVIYVTDGMQGLLTAGCDSPPYFDRQNVLTKTGERHVTTRTVSIPAHSPLG